MKRHKVYSRWSCTNSPDIIAHPEELCEDLDCDYLLPDGGCDKGSTVYDCLDELDADAELMQQQQGKYRDE